MPRIRDLKHVAFFFFLTYFGFFFLGMSVSFSFVQSEFISVLIQRTGRLDCNDLVSIPNL